MKLTDKYLTEQNFTAPADGIIEVNDKLKALINNYKQRGGDFKNYVRDLESASKILVKAARK